MLRKILFTALFLIAPLPLIHAQKKEIAQAKENVKAGRSLAEAEASMRKLLADSANRHNEKIWIVLFDAVRKQYESVNEQMYLKQKADTAKFFAANYRMFGVLEGLDSIDAMPDKNGRVKLNYRKHNSEYLNSFRANLYNGGLFHMGKKEFQTAFNYFAAYVDCAKQPLFGAYDYETKDKRLPTAAFYSVYNGFRTGNAEQTLRYAELAKKDTARLNLVYQYMADTYRAQKDTAKCLEVLEAGFGKYPRSNYFFPHLFDYYFKRGDMQHSLALCNKAIEADSVSVIALFAKSSVMLALKKYDECIALSNRIIVLDSCHADAYLNAGLAYYNQAVDLDTSKRHSRDGRTRMMDLYRKAMPYMQEYRKLAPNEKDLWAMPLYTIYLNLNMGKEFEEIDLLLNK